MRDVVMKESGIVRKLDNLGRLVIPKELRKQYGFTSEVEIIATKEGVLIRNPKYVLVERSKIKQK